MKQTARLVLLLLVAVGLFADCLAGDLPILMSKAGELHLLSGVDGAGGEALRGEALSRELGSEEWALWPPIAWSPQEVRSQGRLSVLQRPSSTHLLGTDDRGRDVASRLVHGTRVSLRLAFWCALLASLVGCGLALLAMYRAALDPLVLTLCDTIAAVPSLLAVLVVVGLTGGQSSFALIILISIPRAASTARVIRDGMQAALAQPFCEAARALGSTRTRLLMRHALPQCWPQLRVAAALSAATAVLAEVALRFLGLGLGNEPSWGELLRQAHDNALLWWLLVPAGLATSLLAWALGRVAAPAREVI